MTNITIENCPKCNKQLPPPLKSSGRQVCTSCGFSDRQNIAPVSNPEKISEPNFSDLSGSRKFKLNFLNKTELILLAIFLGLIFSKLTKPSYEYQIISPSDLSFEESMNKYGSQGWRTVECRRAKDSISDNFSYECIMIREKIIPR
jgi:hypothetical protein